MENVTNEVVEMQQEQQEQSQPAQQQTQPAQQQTQTAIKDIKIENENIALNVLVGMVNIAQKRGAFNLEESAKAWECVQMFMKTQSPAQ
tara:strand:+ start:44 stop:310 length:267 start_codon:yes stop_codon:yes gene_type:complete